MNFKIAGALTAEAMERAKEELENWRKRVFEKIPGEFEKSEKEREWIMKVNRYLKREYEKLGIAKNPAVSPEQIHILPFEVFFKIYPKILPTPGFTDYKTDAINIDKDCCRGDSELFFTILHESIHAECFKKYHFGGQWPELKGVRHGYEKFNLSEKTNHRHFTGLNEAVVGLISCEIFHEHRKEIGKEFKIAFRLTRCFLGSYKKYQRILKIIAAKTAKTPEEREKIMADFKRGLFTGEISHLRKVEKIFGKKSLRVLAALGCPTKNRLPREIITNLVLKYFKTNDAKEREIIAKKVLSEITH